MKETNSQYFSREAVKNGDLAEYVGVLMKQCYSKGGEHYNEILIRPEDCGAFVVESVQIPWGEEGRGRFEYVGEEQVVLTEYVFPDAHVEFLHDEGEYEDHLRVFLKEEREAGVVWERNQFGHWYNKTQQEAWEKQLKESK